MASGPPIEIPMVPPSGSALAIASVPRLPLAPGLFSTTKVWPSFWPSRSPIIRAAMSGVEPGPKGTMILTDLSGHSCAGAAPRASHRPNAASAKDLIAHSLYRPEVSAGERDVCKRGLTEPGPLQKGGQNRLQCSFHKLDAWAILPTRFFDVTPNAWANAPSHPSCIEDWQARLPTLRCFDSAGTGRRGIDSYFS